MSSLLIPPPGGHNTHSVERIGTALLGPLQPLRDARVVHVTAVHALGDTLTTMRIGESTPRSLHDFFVLHLVRAHADAIVSTLKNLRDEPRLSFDLQGPGSLPEGLQDFRRRHLGKGRPPKLVLLSRRGDVDMQHPALRGAGATAIVVPTAQAASLRGRIADAGLSEPVEVWAREHTDLRSVVDGLLQQPRYSTVSIESGPSTARPLYDTPCLIDALALCRFNAGSIPVEVVGGEMLSRDSLETLLPCAHPSHAVDEPSGPWSFQLRHRGLGGSS